MESTADIGIPDQKKPKTDFEPNKFPNTLEGFGYKFIDGKMRNIETGEPFEFEVRKGDMEYNQKRYEALGEVITNYVYDLLIKEGGLKKKVIPVDCDKDFDEPCTFIFHSEDAFVNPKLIMLIHGTGVVRAGQWSRRLIINDCLDSGTQLPFIHKAQELGYGVIVLNTNDNHKSPRSSSKAAESPEGHAEYVWKHLLSPAAAKYVAIVAHSYGGVVTLNLCNFFPTSCKKKIFAVAMTDSVHNFVAQKILPAVRQWLKEVSRNWVKSKQPLDTPISRNYAYDIDCVSAGTENHEMTSFSSMKSVFEFIEQRYMDVVPVSNTADHRGDL